ncbi:MAG: cadmium carbonic anhydrase [bacterium]|nr:cadmium carbonic anhydrase [bacterium]
MLIDLAVCRTRLYKTAIVTLFSCLFATSVPAGGANKIVCEKAGPQAPRDISSTAGSNSVKFAVAPPAVKLNLCDIHFHRNAEHRASGYKKLAGKGDHKGYVCNSAKTTPMHTQSSGHDSGNKGCAGISSGDTVEVHWVFTTCDVKPGPTLNSCFSSTCKNPKLRVEARVFKLTNNASGADFGSFTDYSSGQVKLPPVTEPVEYLGSTTGSGYNDGTCSPFNVTWNVSSSCQPLQIDSINAWCGKKKNAFSEDHAHGVRRLVKDAALLSPIN